MSQSLSFGLIGCGRIAQRHAKVLSELPGARLTAVCDVQPARAKAFGDQYGVPWFPSMDELLERARPDVVCVLTPSGDHAKPAVAAA